MPNEEESLEPEGGMIAFALCVGVATVVLSLAALVHFLGAAS